MPWLSISLCVAIVLVGVFLINIITVRKRNRYQEEGKTYHRPATLKTKQLIGFSKLSKPRRDLITEALEVVTRYGWLKFKLRGDSPHTGGFDCSGAMYFLLRKFGLNAPASPLEQFVWLCDAGQMHKVPATVKSLQDEAFSHLLPGDFLFWKGTQRPVNGQIREITHVSMYLGQKKNGRHVLIGSTKGRKYRGKLGDGYGVYDFKLPRQRSIAEFVGYGTPVGLEKIT